MTENADRFFHTTLKDFQGQLPIGAVGSDGKLSKAITFIPYKGKQEREISELKRTAARGKDFAEATLSVLVSKMPGVPDFSELKLTEKKLAFSSMYVCDIIYAYLLLRCEAVGTMLPVKMECQCKHVNKFDADISTLDVTVLRDGKDLQWEVELRDGLPVCGELRKKLTLQPPVWGLLTTTGMDEDETDQFFATFKASLVSVDGYDGPPVLREQDLDELSKYDIQLLKDSITTNTPTPNMVIEHKCDHCKRPLFYALPWLRDDFFSLGSQQLPKKT